MPHQHLPLIVIKANKVGDFSIGVFPVDFDQAPDEELLFLGSSGMPVVRLSNCDRESYIASPFFLLLFSWCFRHKRGK
jgi:hypothetical protein